MSIIEIGNVQKPSQSSRGAAEIHTKLVERLFLRFSVLYGNKFADMWKGIDLHEVKKCWADELSSYSVQAIAAAVNGLTDKPWPPTLPEFLEMCDGVREAPTIAAHLPYKGNEKVDPNDPEIVAARERCMASEKRGFNRPSPVWAYRAKKRWLNNEIKYNPDVLAMINGAIERDNGQSDPFKGSV
jgi:hypothetical protein